MFHLGFTLLLFKSMGVASLIAIGATMGHTEHFQKSHLSSLRYLSSHCVVRYSLSKFIDFSGTAQGVRHYSVGVKISKSDPKDPFKVTRDPAEFHPH